MIGPLRFYIVDVFAEQQYSGNQLAVFIDAGHLTPAEMQALALEMNYSETTFILSSEMRQGGFDVHIFTPAEEVPFAGHPTLGTAFVIREHLMQTPPDEISLNLPVGAIPVTCDSSGEILWMRQQFPTFGSTVKFANLTKILDVPDSSFDSRFPAQIVSTGLPFLVVPVTSLEAVERAGINHRYYPGELAKLESASVLLFAPETKQAENDLHVRVFAESYGVPEDPATGSANGCLAAYLSRHQYFGGSEVDIRVEQGYEIRRPSLLCLRAAREANRIRVEVGGRVRPVATGRLIEPDA